MENSGFPQRKGGSKRGDTHSCPKPLKAVHGLLQQHVLARLHRVDRLLLDVQPDDPLHLSRRMSRVGAGRAGASSTRGDAGKGGFDETLSQLRVCDGQGGEHDLAGRVVEVGVGDEGAELEDGASPFMGLLDLGFL